MVPWYLYLFNDSIFIMKMVIMGQNLTLTLWTIISSAAIDAHTLRFLKPVYWVSLICVSKNFTFYSLTGIDGLKSNIIKTKIGMREDNFQMITTPDLGQLFMSLLSERSSWAKIFTIFYLHVSTA